VDKIFAVFEAVIIAAFAGVRVLTFAGDYARAINSYKGIQVCSAGSELSALWGLMPFVPSGLASSPAQVFYLQCATVRRSTRSPLGGRRHRSVSEKPIQENDDLIVYCRDHIEMRYPQRPEHLALKDISLRIGAGKSHLFCGTSGSGKSSILALLQRFYEPSSGIITFGGVDHRQLPLEDLRASMAYVSQDAVLFEGSIRWNLALGALDPASVTEDMIRQACEQA
jgi:ATP-binding cassette subfamily B (MDR/TAP) protein 1